MKWQVTVELERNENSFTDAWLKDELDLKLEAEEEGQTRRVGFSRRIVSFEVVMAFLHRAAEIRGKRLNKTTRPLQLKKTQNLT